MSAFLVEAALIDALLTYASLTGPESGGHSIALQLTIPADADCNEGGETETLDFGGDDSHLSEIGGLLLDANAESLAARYGADSEYAIDAFRAADAYRFVRFPAGSAELEPRRVIGLASCFDYQACEFDGWRTSLARVILLSIGNYIDDSLSL